MNTRYDTIELQLDPRGIARLTLDRPERANALNRQMILDIRAALAACAAEDAVRLLVLQARGRHFCAGADTAERAEAPGIPDLLDSLDAFPKPILCLVEGGCIGGGLALAACCDIVLASEGAFFSLPEVRLGLAPSHLLPFFVRFLGAQNFRRFALTGERIGALQAQALGIVHETCATDETETRLAAIVDALLHAAPGATAELKRRLSVWQGDAAAQMQAIRANPPDPAELREGLQAMAEKRKPAWYR
jgi:Enoyl-CoA hydratase/carnithine racemase